MRTAHTNYGNPFIGLVDELFNGKIFHDGTDQLFYHNYPPANISEMDTKFQIELVVPGRKKENFDIKVEKNQLMISYKEEVKSETETTETLAAKKVRTEYKIKNFSRTFTLSDKINTDSIAASYTDGILTIGLDKKEPTEESKKTIAIQ
jgi:HSP20 family protein